MKKCLAVAGFFLAMSNFSAQRSLDVGDFQVNGGVGISNGGIPIYVGLDYVVANNFTLGGELSFRSKTDTDVYGKWRNTGIGIAVNGNYHFNDLLRIPAQFDLYAGGSLGYYNWTNSYQGNYAVHSYTGNYDSGLALSLQIGGRYFFNDNWGVNLEFGGGTISGGKIGATYRF